MFLIIWRGYGILVPILAVIFWLVPLSLLDSALGHSTYHRFQGTFSFVFAAAAACAIWMIGTKLNKVPGRVLIDPRTEQRVILRKHHDLFFIPMQWWAIPVALFGVVSLFS